jgi:putative ABC transport system permease protein
MNVSSVLIPLCLSLSITYCSYLLHQQIHKELAVAIFRLIFQLLLLSYILTWIFNQQGVYVGFAAAVIMTINASLNVKSRMKHQYPGMFLDNLTCLAIILWPLCALGSHSLYGSQMNQASQFLPLLGMLLGNTLNGLSQGLDFFTKDLKEKKDDVLSLIALGATTAEATKALFNQSLRFGLSPNINAMISMGIVSIPGIMTGQLMAGITPLQAVTMQMAMMLLVLSGSYLGLVFSLMLARRRFFNSRGEICF